MLRRSFVPGFCMAAIALSAAVPAAAQNTLRKVTINWGFPQFSTFTAPILSTPKMMKYWEEEGLDVTVIGAPGGTAALQALINGQVQMTFTGTTNIMQLRQQGVAVKAVANIYNKAIYAPAVKADGPIKSIKELEGKTVGICALAASCEYWLNAILNKEGVDPKKVPRVVPGQGGAAAWHALNTGQVAALVWSGAGLEQMTSIGAKLRRFDDLPYLKDLTFVMSLIAHEPVIKNHRKLILGLARGIAKGTAFAMANPEASIRMHWATFPISKPTSLSEEEALAASIKELKYQLGNMADPDQRNFGAVSKASIDAVAAMMLENQVIKQQFPAEDYFTDEFIKEINDFDLAAVRQQAKDWKP